MNELSDWIQNNWYELGSLVAQFAIVAVLMWYGRKTLQIVSAGNGRERAEAPSSEETSFAASQLEPETVGYNGVGHILSEAPASPAETTAVAAQLRSNRLGPLGAMVRWLRRPMNRRAAWPVRTSGLLLAEGHEPQPAGHAGVGRMLSPLPETTQEDEAVAYRYVNRSNPWHAMVNWLSGRQSVAWRRVTVRQ